MAAPKREGFMARGSGALFGALAAARRARALHPRGEGYEAELLVDLDTPRLLPVLAPGRSFSALARLSRASGVPAPLPDARGLAFRLPDARGSGRHQDLLLTSSGAGFGCQHLIVPVRRGYWRRPYSSLLPYRVGGELLMLGALPADDASFRIAVAPMRGGWHPFATLRLGRRLADSDTEGLRFNPWNTDDGLRPAGPAMGLRDAAYRASQAGRPG